MTEPAVDPADAARGSVDNVFAQAGVESAEYEVLRAGGVRAVPVTGLSDLPGAPGRARITAGLTQRQLAEGAEVAERVVQRDESGGYVRATLDRLQRVARVLGSRQRV